MARMTKLRDVAANSAVLTGVGSALRRMLFAPIAVLRAKAVAMEIGPAEYPYAISDPWERCGAPLGL